jgi:hypothetical protein
MRTYVKLKTPIGEKTELKIYTNYDKGGYNYFSGEPNKRGLYVHFSPISRGNGFESTTLLGSRKESGFKVFVKELGRRNDKKEEKLFSMIEPLAAELTQLYEEERYSEIAQKCKTMGVCL